MYHLSSFLLSYILLLLSLIILYNKDPHTVTPSQDSGVHSGAGTSYCVHLPPAAPMAQREAWWPLCTCHWSSLSPGQGAGPGAGLHGFHQGFLSPIHSEGGFMGGGSHGSLHLDDASVYVGAGGSGSPGILRYTQVGQVGGDLTLGSPGSGRLDAVSPWTPARL